MRTETAAVAAAGIDGVAVKPATGPVSRAADLDPDLDVVVDFEGVEHVPAPSELSALAAGRTLRVTTPVRADGFDPLGDDSGYDGLPAAAAVVLVAGNAAYLDARERGRAVAPRLRAAADRFPDAWIGTEGIERLALAVGGTQFDVLGPRTERELRALRAAGHDGGLAVYAPAVLAEDEDAILDALGAYVARRPSVREALPDGAPTDARATGRARSVLSAAAPEYALVGSLAAVRERVTALKAAGADRVVCYPAAGLDALDRR